MDKKTVQIHFRATQKELEILLSIATLDKVSISQALRNLVHEGGKTHSFQLTRVDERTISIQSNGAEEM